MERMHYDELDDKLIVETVYDAQDVLDANAAERAVAPEIKKYRPSMAGLVKVASIHEDHIPALKKMGYDLLSPDPQEVSRALCYIQACERGWMTVNGNPFAMNRPKWR
jgi:hypothetical protein